MSEEITHALPDDRSFEERVFARFDSLDARVLSLESHVERRGFDTKPIWERALAEIDEVNSGLGAVESGLGAVKVELGEVKVGLSEVKVGLGEVKDRVRALEDSTRLTARKLEILNRDLTTWRAEQLGLEDRVEKLETKNPS